MNEEIKEILDNIEIITRNGLDYLLRNHQSNILLDCITNLQQERNDMACLNNELQEKIDKALEYSKGNIKALENRLNSPFCNFDKAAKEICIHVNYLEILGGDSNEK